MMRNVELPIDGSGSHTTELEKGDEIRIVIPDNKIMDIIFPTLTMEDIDMSVYKTEDSRMVLIAKYTPSCYYGYHSVNQKTIFHGIAKEKHIFTVISRNHPMKFNNYFISTSPQENFLATLNQIGKKNLTFEENTITCLWHVPNSVSKGYVQYSAPPQGDSYLQIYQDDKSLDSEYLNSGKIKLEATNPYFVYKLGSFSVLILFFEARLSVSLTASIPANTGHYYTSHIDQHKSQFLLTNRDGVQPIPPPPVSNHTVPRLPEQTKAIPQTTSIPPRKTTEHYRVPTASLNHDIAEVPMHPPDNGHDEPKKHVDEKDNVKVLAIAITFGTIGSILVIGLLILIGFICYHKIKAANYRNLNQMDNDNVPILFDNHLYQPPSYPVDPYYYPNQYQYPPQMYPTQTMP